MLPSAQPAARHRNSVPDGTALTVAACAGIDDTARQNQDAGRDAGQLATAKQLGEILSGHRRLSTVGEMAATLAHQVRTPLTAALLYAGNARRNDLPPARRTAQLDKAIACMRDLERLIADMLQFARGARPAETRFTVGELLAGVEDALAPIVDREQRLDIEAPAATCVIEGNRETLAGALINLASNALQAAGAGAHVRIGVETRPAAVLIRVRDNGPGVPAALRERIFEPFFTSRADGTGLGLAVARSVARAHGGELLLEDARRGHTTFTLQLAATTAHGEDTTRHTHDNRNATA